MFTRRHVLKLGIAAGLVPLALKIVPASAATQFKAYTYAPVATQPGAKILQQITDRITAETDGEIQFQINLAGSLPISGNDITQAVGNGFIHFATDAFFAGSVPVRGILRLPMLLNDLEEYQKAFAVVEPHLKEGFRKQGVELLGHYLYPTQVIFSASEIRSLDDLRGKKIRVTSAEQAAFIEQYGGIPVTIATAEVMPALQRGVVEGVLTASIGGAAIWHELLKYNLRLGPNFNESVVIMNADAFQSLTPEQQEIVTTAAREISQQFTQQMAEQEPAATDEYAAAGMVVTPADSDEVARAVEVMRTYWDEWARQQGGNLPEVLADVRAAIGK